MKKKILIFGASSFLAQNYINCDNYNDLICLVRAKKKKFNYKVKCNI